MKLNYFLFVVLFTNISIAQNKQMNCATNIKINQTVNYFKSFKYPNDSKILKLNDFKKVNNDTPEKLLRSVISASNLEWFNYNNKEKVENSTQDFEFIKNSKSNELFAILLYKINFKANGKEYAVLKYNLHQKNKIICYAETMVKIKGKWFVMSEGEIFPIFGLMMMIDIKYIDAILNNKTTDNIELNKIIVSSRTSTNQINLNEVIFKISKEISTNNILKLVLDTNRLFK